jgi:hypothetical protein
MRVIKSQKANVLGGYNQAYKKVRPEVSDKGRILTMAITFGNTGENKECWKTKGVITEFVQARN